MKRLGRRGRDLGQTGPDEDLLDDETRKQLLEGWYFHEMSEIVHKLWKKYLEKSLQSNDWCTAGCARPQDNELSPLLPNNSHQIICCQML